MKVCSVSWCCALRMGDLEWCVVHAKHPEYKKPEVKHELVKLFNEAMKK